MDVHDVMCNLAGTCSVVGSTHWVSGKCICLNRCMLYTFGFKLTSVIGSHSRIRIKFFSSVARIPRKAFHPFPMQCTDIRIPRGYRAIYKTFLVLQRRNLWILENDGSIPIQTLISYIELQFQRVMAKDIKMSTLYYYLSALKSIHDSNGIVWQAREDRRVKFLLKRLLRTPGLPSQEGTSRSPCFV
jgi:hypothetical protein